MGAGSVGNGDLLQLVRRPPGGQQPAASSQAPARAAYDANGYLTEPEAVMQSYRNNPAALAGMPPPIADAIRTGDVRAFQVDGLLCFHAFCTCSRNASQRLVASHYEALSMVHIYALTHNKLKIGYDCAIGIIRTARFDALLQCAQ